MRLSEKYGPWAIVAGASEGLGASFARALAAGGLNLILISRREQVLRTFGEELIKDYAVQVKCLSLDLSASGAVDQIREAAGPLEINLLVYNAAESFIGSYLDTSASQRAKMAAVNMITPLNLVHHFGGEMVRRGKGGVVLMSSLAGFQGSGFLALYAATKAFNRVLAESLWYEWARKGVDVIACCAGATATPGYIRSKPGKLGLIEPQVQLPEQVVKECLARLGQVPSFISGRGNRVANFFMSRIFSRKRAVTTISDATRKLYGLG